MLASEFKDSNDFAVRDVCVEGFTRLLQNDRAPYKQKEILVEMMLMYHSTIPPGLDPTLRDEVCFFANKFLSVLILKTLRLQGCIKFWVYFSQNIIPVQIRSKKDVSKCCFKW